MIVLDGRQAVRYRGPGLSACMAWTSAEVAGLISLQAPTDAAIATRPMTAANRLMLSISSVPCFEHVPPVEGGPVAGTRVWGCSDRRRASRGAPVGMATRPAGRCGRHAIERLVTPDGPGEVKRSAS